MTGFNKHSLPPLECWMLVVKGQKQLMLEIGKLIDTAMLSSDNKQEIRNLTTLKADCKLAMKRLTLLYKANLKPESADDCR